MLSDTFDLDSNQTAPNDSTPLQPKPASGSVTLPPVVPPVNMGSVSPTSPISRSTNPLPPVSAPSMTQTPLPGVPKTSTTAPSMNFNSPIFGGGWSQYATEPGSVQNALAQQFSNGVYGQAAVDALNQNPATSGVAYYGSSGMYGLPNGYYAAPNTSGGLDLIQRAAGDNGQPSSSGSPDLSGLLTSLLSAFSAQPQNTIAAMPAPTAPNLTPTSSPTSLSSFINPMTGLPMFGQNPVTGQLNTNPSGITPLSASTSPDSTARTTMSSSVGGGAPPPIVAGPLTPSAIPPGGVARNGAAPAQQPELPAGVSLGGVDPTTGALIPATSTGTSTDTSGNPFSDPTQMQLWNSVMAALNQSQQQPGNNPQTQALYSAIAQIAQNLQGPAFSDQQLNNIRTASMDSIQADEDNAVQAEIQRQGLLGQSPTSGTVTDAVNKIKASYTTLKGQAQQANNVYELNTVAQRQQELLSTLNLGAQTATGNSQLGFQNLTTGAELSTLPVTAENNALANALSVTNSTNPMGLISALLATISSNNQSGQINGQNNAALAQQLGNLLAGFL